MDMISKKELLAQTGISYGQLYRWKREGLLPEEWFIKQSSFTGQETFFPKDQVLSRIRMINEMKDSYSLEELSRILVTTSDSLIHVETLAKLSEIDSDFISFISQTLDKTSFTMGELAVAYAIYQKGIEVGISQEKISDLVRTALPAMEKRPIHDTLCCILDVNGKYHLCFSTGAAYPSFDSGIKVLGTISIGVTMNMLQVQLETENTLKTTEEK